MPKKYTDKEILDKVRAEEMRFAHSVETRAAKLCLVRANQWRKRIGVEPREYIALAGKWDISHGIPDDLEVYEDDTMKDMQAAEARAARSEVVQDQKPPEPEPITEADAEKVSAMVKIADIIATNPGIRERKDYKKQITKKAGVDRKYVDLFFTDKELIVNDPVGQALNFQSMSNSQVYTTLRKKDIELLNKAQQEIEKAMETGFYNGKRVSLPQILEASKVLGTRIKQYEAGASHKPKLDKLPAASIIILAQFVKSNGHQIRKAAPVEVIPTEDEPDDLD